MSANRTVAPERRTAFTVAGNVNGSSRLRRPPRRRGQRGRGRARPCRRRRPPRTGSPRARREPRSKASTSGPCASRPLRSTRSTASRSSAPMTGPPRSSTSLTPKAPRRMSDRAFGARRDPLAASANPPHRLSGVPHDQPVRLHVLGHDRPAPTAAHSPIVRPHTIVAFAPIDAPLRTSVETNSRSSPVARGCRSFVKTTEGPTKTSSSSVTPEYTETKFWILQPDPITAPVSTKTDLPRTHRIPTRAPLRTCAKCQTRAVPHVGAVLDNGRGIDRGSWRFGRGVPSAHRCFAAPGTRSCHETGPEPQAHESHRADHQQQVVPRERPVAEHDGVLTGGDAHADEAGRTNLGATGSPSTVTSHRGQRTI